MLEKSVASACEPGLTRWRRNSLKSVRRGSASLAAGLGLTLCDASMHGSNHGSNHDSNNGGRKPRRGSASLGSVDESTHDSNNGGRKPRRGSASLRTDGSNHSNHGGRKSGRAAVSDASLRGGQGFATGDTEASNHGRGILASTPASDDQSQCSSKPVDKSPSRCMWGSRLYLGSRRTTSQAAKGPAPNVVNIPCVRTGDSAPAPAALAAGGASFTKGRPPPKTRFSESPHIV